MRFVLYTDKSVAECMTAINQRMQARATGARPELDGYIEKSGRFSLSMTSRVMRRFNRRTRLRARAKRAGNITIVRGFVPGGLSREGQAVIFGVLVLVAGILLARGNAVLAITVLFVGVAIFVPLTGDYHNSVVLFSEVKKALHARETPPEQTAKAARRSR